MSLFGTTSGFGTGGTSMFGSTTTDNHNPMKVPNEASWGLQRERRPGFPAVVTAGEIKIAWEPPLG